MLPRVSVQWVSVSGAKRLAKRVRRSIDEMGSPVQLTCEPGDLLWIDGGDTPLDAIEHRLTRNAIVTSERAEICSHLVESNAARAVCYVGPAAALHEAVVDLGALRGSGKSDDTREQHAAERLVKILGRMASLPHWSPRTPIAWPLFAMVEVVRVCNLRCPLCPVGNDEAEHYDNMSAARFREVIDALAGTVASISLYNYGEPLLHPHIAELVAIAKNQIEHVAITTNGTVLRRGVEDELVAAQLDSIRISIDGASQEAYEKYRVGGSLEKVWTNLRRIVAAKGRAGSSKPWIEAQFIVNRFNEHQVEEFRHLAMNAGADEIRLKTFNALMTGPRYAAPGRDFLPRDQRYSRYADYERLEYRDRYRLSRCEWPLVRTVINADGSVVPCCYDFNGRHRLGTFATGEKNWWLTGERIAFRERLQRDPMSIDICSVCPVGIPSLDVSLD